MNDLSWNHLCADTGLRCTTLPVAVLAAMLFSGTPVIVADTYMTNAVGIWTNSVMWDNGVPGPGDTAYVASGSPSPNSAEVTIDAPGAEAGNLYIARHNYNSGKLILTNDATLHVHMNLSFGVYGGSYSLSMSSNSTLTVGRYLQAGGNNAMVLEYPDNITIHTNLYMGVHSNGRGTNTIIQNGGTLSVGNGVILGQTIACTGVYHLANGGTLNCASISVGSTGGEGMLIMDPGTQLTCDQMQVANGSSFTYRPDDFTVTADSLTLAAASHNPDGIEGVLTQDGGTACFNIVRVGHNYGPNLNSGVYNLSNGATLKVNTMTVRPYSNICGRISGWGTVEVTNSFRANGRIIADGYGDDQDLVITNIPPMLNDESFPLLQGDGTQAGWYAVNGGRLRLPDIQVGPGNNAYNWGEQDGDTAIDLVNSIRLAFSGVQGGRMTVFLVATDRDDSGVSPSVPVIGEWEFEPSVGFDFASGSVTMTFRYDDLLASAKGLSEEQLRVWELVGNHWENITATLDTNANTVTTVSCARFSKVAVSVLAPAPPGGTVIVIE